MNRIMATGRPVRDCVKSDNTLDKTLCKFYLACKADYYTDNEIHTDFIKCVAWDKTAEFLINNVKKGDLICIAGTLTSRNYEAEGKKEVIWEVKVDRVELLAKNEKEEPKPAEPTKDDNCPF